MGPVQASERYEFLDVLRGAALLGIVSANMILYSLYLQVPEAAKAALPAHAADKALDFLELWLIEGKFYTLFSLLFGIGFSILLTRAQAKGLVFRKFFLRRAFFMFLIGATHAVLVWHDDILEAYSICGALLLPFTSVRSRTIIAVAIVALLAPALVKLLGGIPVGALDAARSTLLEHFGFTRDTMLQTYTQGGVADIVRLNLCNWFGQVTFLIKSGMIFKIYGCFLLGFCIGRDEVYKKLAQYRPLIRRIAVWGLAIGLPLNFTYAASFETDTWTEMLSGSFGILPLSAGYASMLCLIWLRPEGPRQLRHFAPVGRMALTNYIGQSVLCTLVFYNTGLGLGGTMGPSLYFLIGFTVYGFEVIASRWWLDRFRFGPIEWLWQMLTYGRRFPLAKRAAHVEEAT